MTTTPAGGPATHVDGLLCRKDHFNDPAAAYCAVCGLSMLQAARTLVRRSRPQLGVLVFETGMLVPVRRDLVLGRAAEGHDTVRAGAAGAIRLVDPHVSPVHATIALDGWTVMVHDAGSANGTLVCRPGQGAWTRVEPGEGAELVPGTTLALGRCVLTYHSYRRRAQAPAAA